MNRNECLIVVNGERVILPFEEMSLERFLTHISVAFGRDLTGKRVILRGNDWGPYPIHRHKILKFRPEERVRVE